MKHGKQRPLLEQLGEIWSAYDADVAADTAAKSEQEPTPMRRSGIVVTIKNLSVGVTLDAVFEAGNGETITLPVRLVYRRGAKTPMISNSSQLRSPVFSEGLRQTLTDRCNEAMELWKTDNWKEDTGDIF